jgi:four helix bundle protein
MSEPLAFHFETLNVYRLAIGVARWTRTVGWPPNTRSLQDQATRATDSVVLNLCEGLSRKGRAGANQLRIARASAAEAFAALDILPDFDESRERRADLRRISAMIAGLQRS